MRLFLALDPTAEARGRLAGVARGVFSLDPAFQDCFRPTAVDNLHVTLHFLGEIQAERLSRIVGALGDAVAEPAFDISIGRPDVFPRRGQVRGLMLAILHGSDAVCRLHAELATRLTRAEVALDPRPFSPHVTIARARRGGHRMSGLGSRLESVPVDEVRWRVTQVTMFESDLSGPAPRYAVRHIVRLAGPPG